MDINLPGISGIQAMQILRDDPLTRYIPVLALSANAKPRDIWERTGSWLLSLSHQTIKFDELLLALEDALKFSDMNSIYRIEMSPGK